MQKLWKAGLRGLRGGVIATGVQCSGNSPRVSRWTARTAPRTFRCAIVQYLY